MCSYKWDAPNIGGTPASSLPTIFCWYPVDRDDCDLIPCDSVWYSKFLELHYSRHSLCESLPFRFTFPTSIPICKTQLPRTQRPRRTMSSTCIEAGCLVYCRGLLLLMHPRTQLSGHWLACNQLLACTLMQTIEDALYCLGLNKKVVTLLYWDGRNNY